ncbi:hypothetical protein ACJ41O_012943 [Fusarium nematophilum]
MLLESARLALPARGASEAATRTSDGSDVVVETKTVVGRADSHLVTVASTLDALIEQHPQSTEQLSTDYDTEPTEAPSEVIGWLSLSDPDPTTTEPSAPPESVGWLADPTTTSIDEAPGPEIGWLLNDDIEVSPQATYFIGTFLPVLVASIFAIPWKILDLEAKSLEPFAQLARPSGGTAPHTLLLHYNGFSGFLAAFAAPFTGHSAVALSTFLSYSSALLIPLATGSVGLTLRGECLQDWKKHCSAVLEAVDPTIRATQGVLAAMACAVIAYMVLLRGRTFGVVSDPRSVLGIASLSLNPYLSDVMRKITLGPDGMFSGSRAAAAFESRIFQFGYITYASGEQEYGIIVMNNFTECPAQVSGPPSLALDVGPSKRSVVSGILIRAIGFALFVIGVLVLILYYSLTYTDTGFERFMSSQTKFGPRFLFALFGVIVGFGWASIFNELAMILPAWDMSRRPEKLEHSILMPLNPNPYVGVATYLSRRHKLLALVSVVTVLSDFLPILFANVPFSNAITWKTHEICVWTSVGVLSLMLAVLALIAGILLCKYPHHHFPFTPTDFGTLTAVLYLTCRSEDFLAQVQGLSVAREADMKKWIEALDSRYSIISVMGEDGNPHVMMQVS